MSEGVLIGAVVAAAYWGAWAGARNALRHIAKQDPPPPAGRSVGLR